MDILIEEFDGALWTVATEKNKITGIEIDSPDERVRWGDIFLAQVKTIDSARDAAFLDLDGENTGILFNKHVRLPGPDGTTIKGGDVSIGKLISPGQVLLVQAKTGIIPSASANEYETKIPELSMDISLQGRYLIYCPMMKENRLSQRITNPKLRKQITAMMDKLNDMGGCILRASAAYTQSEILSIEAKTLKKIWHSIQEKIDQGQTGFLHPGLNALQRILSDQALEQINRIEVVILDHYKSAEDWCIEFAPDLITKITPVELSDGEQDLALLHERDVMEKIGALLKPYATLPGGGNIIIQETSALTAIDVNKGNDKNAHISTNQEAVREAIRQIILRNLGGTIIVDCINTKNKKEKDTLIKLAKSEAEKDSCTLQIHGFTATGLLEISRARRTPPLALRIDPNEVF